MELQHTEKEARMAIADVTKTGNGERVREQNRELEKSADRGRIQVRFC